MSWVKRLVSSRPFQQTAGAFTAEYLRLVWNTTRLVIEPDGIYERVDRDAPVIIAFWHGQHFLAPFIRREGDRAKVLVSRHRDGEINAIAAERLGVGAIRGSGHHGSGFVVKGGVNAFREMLNALEAGYNVARVTALLAGLEGAPGVTVNRYCSSSLQTIRMAAHAIKAGEGDVFVAGGVETVSRFRSGMSDGGPGTHNEKFADAEARTEKRTQGGQASWEPISGLPDIYIAMGQTAETSPSTPR